MWGGRATAIDAGKIPWRRALAGTLAGVPGGLLLATVVEPWPVGLLVGPTFGLLFGLATRPSVGSSVDFALGAAALAVPAWAFVQVTAVPLLTVGTPAWTPAAAVGLLSTLAAWVVAGAVTGAVVDPVHDAVERRFGPTRTPEPPSVQTRIVVLGSGFVGYEAVARLESLFGPDPTVELTLVSKTNALLFTPMLAEVAGGSVEPSHIVSPLRTSLKRTRVVQADVVDVDFDDERVVLSDSPEPPERLDGRARVDGGTEAGTDGGTAEQARRPAGTSLSSTDPGPDGDSIPFDHLVFGLGSVSDYRGATELAAFAFEFKTLADAMAIRAHVVDCFERAERTSNPERRRALVTFVVAGGGFAGAELAGALNDLARGIAVYYPNVRRDSVRVLLVHSRERILPELGDSLAAYARRSMAERGVEFALGLRVEGGSRGRIALSNGETIRSETLVWTAGNRPNPLVERLDVPLDGPAISVDEHLSVPDRPGVWAAGDCAAVVDAETGERHPATAQHAVRAARALADNVHATVTGGEPRPFSYRSRGSLCVVGHQTACAELGSRRFSGLFAWLLWRAIYLAKLPGLDRQLRVAFDWFVELFFPRDVVQTLPRGERRE